MSSSHADRAACISLEAGPSRGTERIEHLRTPSFDGLPLDVFATPRDRDRTVVFVNAFGIPAEVSFDLARALYAAGIAFVTWESRGLPGPFAGDVRGYTPECHARDLVTVATALRFERIAVLGWCSGAEVALMAAAHHPELIERLVLVNGYYSWRRPNPPVLGAELAQLMRLIVENEKNVPLYYAILQRSGRLTRPAVMNGSQLLVKSIAAPFEAGPQALLRYARMHVNLQGNDIESWCRAVATPTLVIGGRQDAIARGDDAARLAGLIGRGESIVVEQGDHYSVFTSPEINEIVVRTLLGPSCGPSDQVIQVSAQGGNNERT